MKWIAPLFYAIWKLYFGLMFILSTLLFYPIIVPFLWSEQGKKKSFKLFVAWSWTVRLFAFIRVKKVKNASIPQAPYIIVANHSSYLDIFLLPSIIPNHPFLYLGKSEILKYPLIKTYFKRLNIPVYRNNAIKAAKSLVYASKEVKKGWSLVIFPEGGIPDNNHPKMIPFKDGAFQLAKNAKVPIVPMTYTNNSVLLSEPFNLFRSARPGVCKVHIHETIEKETIASLTVEELKKRCFETINSPILQDHPEFKE